MSGRVQTYLLLPAVFAAALLAGKFLFENIGVTDVGRIDDSSSRLLVSSDTAKKPVAPSPITASPTPKKISRDLVPLEDGVVNKNERMTTVIHQNYSRGAQYFPGRGLQGTLVYKPLEMRIANGFEPVQAIPFDLDLKGELETSRDVKRYVYRDTYPHVDERMYIRADGGKEHDYILKNKPEGIERGDNLTFRSRLELGKGMSLWEDGKQLQGRHKTSKELQFRDENGRVLFEMRRPIAYDNNVTAEDGSLNEESQEDFVGSIIRCDYLLEIGEGYVDLAVATPTAWLNESNRAYPVTVDPNIGAGGLTDAIYNNGQPIYTGAVSTGTFFGIHNGAINPDPTTGGNTTVPPTFTPTILSLPCPLVRGVSYNLNQFLAGGRDCGVAVLPMPFDFWFYGLHPQCSPLFVVTDGYACWLGYPLPVYCQPNTFIPNPAAPNWNMFAYWDDLAISNDDRSGIYAMMDGDVGNRRLILEWYRMSFVAGEASDRISFNLILHECNNLVEIVIGNPQADVDALNNANNTTRQGEIDRGEASVGIENLFGNIGIQYDFNSSQAGSLTPAGEKQALEPITMGTAVIFTPVPQLNLTVTIDGNTVTAGQAFNPGNCLPVKSCFDVLIIPPDTSCGKNTSGIVPSFGFQWTLTLPNDFGGETIIGLKKTPKFCHTFTIPGSVKVTLEVVDGQGFKTTFGSFTYLVCDVPRIELTAAPQGGLLPLTTQFHTVSSATFLESISANPADDINLVPICPNTVLNSPTDIVVDPGDDGILHTRPNGDDVLDIINNTILVGPNLIPETIAVNGRPVVVVGGVDSDGDGLPDCLASTAGGDDDLVGINIHDGGNLVSETTATTPDIQTVQVRDRVGPAGSPIWRIEKLSERDLQSQPAFIGIMDPGNLDPSWTFTQDGIYKVTVLWTGIDNATRLPTISEYSIFIFAEDGNQPNDDNMIIEGSDFTLVWKGKKDREDDQDLHPQNPDLDSLAIRGWINMPNLSPTALGSTPIRARVLLNGTLPLFEPGDGVLDPTGSLTVNSQKGVQRTFTLNLPGGRFSIYNRNIRLDQVLGLIDRTENRLLPANIRVELYDYSDPNNPVALYPQEPEARGAMITYDYRSVVNGQAIGRYRFGDFTGDGFFVAATPGRPGSPTSAPVKPVFNIVKEGGQMVLVSGGFLVLQCNAKLTGGSVTLDIRGKLARFGGDFLNLNANSELTVEIGPAMDSQGNTIANTGFRETLNISTSPKWTVRGGSKKRGASYIFNRDKSLGQTGLQSLTLANRAGDFRIKTYALSNLDDGTGGIGLDVSDITQVIPIRIFITHENDNGFSLQNLDARTEFLMTKSGTTTFSKK